MCQKEPLHRAVKDDHFDVLVSFERCDDLIQLRNGLRTKDIQGRVVKRNPPVGWRTSFETNLSGICHVAHDGLLLISATQYGSEDRNLRGSCAIKVQEHDKTRV